MLDRRKNVGLIAICIWIGFIGAISFMEAWLKFRAPGVTLPIGLGIGRLVFAALNKMEWAAFLIASASLFRFKVKFSDFRIVLLVAGGILIIQTLWLLPGLDARAQQYIDGAPIQPSNLHIYYVVAEGGKLIALATSVLLLVRNKTP